MRNSKRLFRAELRAAWREVREKETVLGIARIVADVVLIVLIVMDLKDKFRK